MSMSREAKEEASRLIRQGNKLQAVKYLHDTFSISLADAKALVDALAAEIGNGPTVSSAVSSTPFTSLTLEDKSTIEDLLRQNKKIEAVKYLHTKFNLGLKGALTHVEIIQKEIDPNFVPSRGGCALNIFRIVAFSFGFIGMLLLGIGLLIYYLDAAVVKEENKTRGVVTGLIGSNTLAPTITYSWNGKSYTYQSTLYSNPPAFEINEEVMLYVNPQKPEEVVIDTFSERWLAIVILSAIGGVFVFLSIIFLFNSRKF